MLVKPKKAAVITGDVVGSSRLSLSERKKLQEEIQKHTKNLIKKYPGINIQQYRGDSIQAVIFNHISMSLRIALQFQCYLLRENFKIRLAIGLGEVTFQSKDVITSDGTAFQFSGTLIDELKKKGELIGVISQDENFSKEWKVHSASLNFLLQRLSAAQSEAVYLLLQDMKQDDIAQELKISQPSVHQRLQAAGSDLILQIIERFQNTVPLL